MGKIFWLSIQEKKSLHSLEMKRENFWRKVRFFKAWIVIFSCFTCNLKLLHQLSLKVILNVSRMTKIFFLNAFFSHHVVLHSRFFQFAKFAKNKRTQIIRGLQYYVCVAFKTVFLPVFDIPYTCIFTHWKKCWIKWSLFE